MSYATIKPENCVPCGEIVDLAHPPETAGGMSSTLVQSDDLQVTRLVVQAGQELPPQRTVGDVTLQCVEGRVQVTIIHDDKLEEDVPHDLGPGEMVYLCAKMPHTLKGIEDSVLVMTMVLPNDKPQKPVDVVEQASVESFPASDPPSH